MNSPITKKPELLQRSQSTHSLSSQKSLVNDAESQEDSKITTRSELYAWWAYFVGYEPISAVLLVFLVPTLLEEYSRMVGHTKGSLTMGCFDKDKPCILFTLGAVEVKSTTFTYLTLGVSAFVQAIAFVSIGALADYGNFRKTFLSASTLAGVVSATSILFVINERYFWLCAIIQILIGLFSGLSIVFYNSYLPLLAQNHPEYRKAVQRELDEIAELQEHDTLSSTTLHQQHLEQKHQSFAARVAVGERITNWISTVGFISGYFASLLLLCLSAVFIYIWGSKWTDKEYNIFTKFYIASIGLWWGLVSIYSFCFLKNRPGPPIPPGTNYLTFSWKKLSETLGKAKKLPNTFRYLACYFFFSDGFNTIGMISVLFCKEKIEGVTRELLFIALAFSLLSAMIGNFVFMYIQRKFNLPMKSMLVFMLLAIGLIPIYGAIGLFTDRFGLTKAFEVIPMAIYYGTFIGAVQSFSRVLFSDMIPLAEESEFFTLYAVADKASSWMGPIFSAIITQISNARYGLLFLALLLIVPMPILLLYVDPVKGKEDSVMFSRNREYREQNET